MQIQRNYKSINQKLLLILLAMNLAIANAARAEYNIDYFDEKINSQIEVQDINTSGNLLLGTQQSGGFTQSVIKNYNTGSTIIASKSNTNVNLYSISNDGLFAGGETSSAASSSRAAIYDVTNNTITNISTDLSSISGISDNHIAVGYVNKGSKMTAFKYDIKTNTFFDIDAIINSTTPTSTSSAAAISNNGSYIVGKYFKQGESKSNFFKYNNSLNSISYINSPYNNNTTFWVANNGIIVGYSSSNNYASTIAFKIDTNNNYISLPSLANNSNSTAFATSDDGSVTVGSSINANGKRRAVFWNANNQINEIGTLGGDNSDAIAISGDGSIIIGDSEFEVGNSDTRPFIYKDFQIFDIENSIKSAYYNNLQLNSIFNNKVNVINYNLNQECNNYGRNNSCIGFYSRYASLNKSKIDNSNIGTNLFFGQKINRYLSFNINLDQAVASDMPSNFTLYNNLPTVTTAISFANDYGNNKFSLKLATSYNKQKLGITRSNFGFNESGYGESELSSFATMANFSYKRILSKKVRLGLSQSLRKIAIIRDGYKEEEKASLPFTFEKAKFESLTSITSLEANFYPNKKMAFFINGGAESDINNKIDGFSGQQQYLGRFSLQPQKVRYFRPFITIGSSIMINDNSSINFSINNSIQPFNNQKSTLTAIGYNFGF